MRKIKYWSRTYFWMKLACWLGIKISIKLTRRDAVTGYLSTVRDQWGYFYLYDSKDKRRNIRLLLNEKTDNVENATICFVQKINNFLTVQVRRVIASFLICLSLFVCRQMVIFLAWKFLATSQLTELSLDTGPIKDTVKENLTE